MAVNIANNTHNDISQLQRVLIIKFPLREEMTWKEALRWLFNE